MTVYFTSDLHFGHRLVAAHRGFGDDTAAHDQALMDRWRSVVKKDDQVWVLGDLCLIDPEYAFGLVRRLPGVKHFIAGNHDPCHPMHRQAHKFQRRYLEVFDSVQPFARRRIDGQEVLLSHFPYSRDRGEARYTQYRLPNEGKWLLHGHTHGDEKVTHLPEPVAQPAVREIHVGVDAWDLTPVSLDQVVDLMREGAH
jgi:calcineurin-like phosphoesterase family protein